MSLCNGKNCRLAVGEKQSAVDLLAGDITSQDIFPDDKNKMETDISNCADAVDPQSEVGKEKKVIYIFC